MAFDAGFVAAIVYEMNRELIGAKIERVNQPGKDLILLQVHPDRATGARYATARLLIDAGSNNPRIGFTEQSYENPKVPPMFCMLLRKYLTGARIISVRQLGFERAVEIGLDARDEMGFVGRKYLICETMGRCSNLIFLDQDYRILSALRSVDFSTSRVRQILPGVVYELPPIQPGKVSPLDADRDAFLSMWEAERETIRPDKFIMSHYLGISPLIAREVVHRAGMEGKGEDLWNAFFEIYSCVRENRYTPTLVCNENGDPIEYSFTRIFQYGGAKQEVFPDFSTLTDTFFGAKSKNEQMKIRASDILRLLTNAETRLKKKIALQSEDLAASAGREIDKLYGDLITANIYRLERGMKEAKVENYYSEDYETVLIPLDARLTPAQNAQKYYKRYAKAKSAEVHLTQQLVLARSELSYVDTVFDALTRAETESDLEEIRRELYESGYASKMRHYTVKKPQAPKPLEFRSPSGYRILCGKNNAQNDYITHKIAQKSDLWFHIHGMPGSHVVLFCDGEEPTADDYTLAATIAATHSKAPRGTKVCVDYTRIKNVKKPPASKPGYVTYSTNFAAWVEADEKAIEAARVTKK